MLTPELLLQELVRRPSLNPMGRTDLSTDLIHEHRVTDYLEARLQELGLPYRRMIVQPGRDNLIAEFIPEEPTGSVIWEAHQDTVPVDGMTIDPFAGELREGRIWGRGACDVKAGIAVMLTAFSRLCQERPRRAARVTLCFTVDEEHTFLGVQELVKQGIRADVAICAEPTGLNIVQAHKGVVRWQIETVGVACHSSRPSDGNNAIYRMMPLVQKIEEYASALSTCSPDPLLGLPTLSLGIIQGGVSPNTVPDRCRVDLDRRLLPGENPQEAIADLTEYLRSRLGEQYPFRVKPVLACPPLTPQGNQDLVHQLGKSIDAVIGRHEVHAVPYGTDASTLGEAGIPSVVFGPGSIVQAHTRDEWIAVDQLAPAVEILLHFAKHYGIPTTA